MLRTNKRTHEQVRMTDTNKNNIHKTYLKSTTYTNTYRPTLTVQIENKLT